MNKKTIASIGVAAVIVGGVVASQNKAGVDIQVDQVITTDRFKGTNQDRYFLFDEKVVSKVIPNKDGTVKIILKNGKETVKPFSWTDVDQFEATVKNEFINKEK